METNGYQFSPDELKRYRGHMSLCEIDMPGQARICRSRALIVGAGGLGSPVAMYLAAAGTGTVGIIDGDSVSLSNLQRQIMHGSDDVGLPKVDSARRTLQAINGHVRINTYQMYLSPENAEEMVWDYDLVIDCCDNFATRLLISDICVRLAKPFVFGGVSRFCGQVFTHLPGTADFRDFFGDEAPGDAEPCVLAGILNSVVGVTGTLQATEAIKIMTGTGGLLTDTLLVFDAITMEFRKFGLQRVV